MRQNNLTFPEAVRYLDPTTPPLITIKNYSKEKLPQKTAAAQVKREPLPVAVREKVVIQFSQTTTAEHECLGREYCKKRGISDATIDFALEHKVISFGVSNFLGDIEKNRAGVRFLGYDEFGDIRSAETRHLTQARSALAEKGSDRSFCPVLPGNTKSVHVVEGGFDGLALIDMCRRHKLEQPHIIISGGCGRSFIDNHVIKPLLLTASKIIIWGENEVGNTLELQANKQYETDKKHSAQRAKMIEVGVSAIISINKPRDGYKDLADKNLSEVLAFKELSVIPKKNMIELSSVTKKLVRKSGGLDR